MARKKPETVERRSVAIGISLVPAYAISFDHPSLSGITALGLSPAKVMSTARGIVARQFPLSHFDVTVTELTPERFDKVNLHFDAE